MALYTYVYTYVRTYVHTYIIVTCIHHDVYEFYKLKTQGYIAHERNETSTKDLRVCKIRKLHVVYMCTTVI